MRKQPDYVTVYKRLLEEAKKKPPTAWRPSYYVAAEAIYPCGPVIEPARGIQKFSFCK